MDRAGTTLAHRMVRATLMLAAGALLLSVLAGASSAAAWELEKSWSKPVTDGVHYELHRYQLENGPAALHLLKIDPYSGYNIRPVLPSGGLGELESIGSMAKRAGALAAVNGTFFDTDTHLPVGFLRVDHRTVFGQHLNRALLGIDQFGGLHFERTRPRLELSFPGVERSLKISKVNYRRGRNMAVLYTPEFGPRTGTNRWGFELVLTPEPGVEPSPEYGMSGQWRVTGAAPKNARIPENGMVLSVHQSLEDRLGWLKQQPVGSEVSITTNLPGGWDSFPHVVGAGPLLLSANRIVLDPQAESFNGYMKRPAARTALAKTADGKTLIAVASSDPGRGLSGISWWQLALLLRDSLNATAAMGLDGGSSSALWLNGEVKNYPYGGTPRDVANILAVVPLGSEQP